VTDVIFIDCIYKFRYCVWVMIIHVYQLA
jgi:hypothetical protein